MIQGMGVRNYDNYKNVKVERYYSAFILICFLGGFRRKNYFK